MLTVEHLREVATEAFENDEWICLKSGESFTILKNYSAQDVENMIVAMEDGTDNEESCVWDNSDNACYTDVERAKDWNFFKNTMAI